jgi:geranylgeranyl diphosphate synthase, type II
LANNDCTADLKSERLAVEKNLRRLLDGEKGIPVRLKKAMRHSLTAGGKRLRPILMLWAYDAASKRKKSGKIVKRQDVMVAACALEMLHTYSLIHDDLPAMDDDVLRRGKPTCHVAFDEPTAILAGDGLQAMAFSLLARAGGIHAGPLVDLVGLAVGPSGMVGGQQEDLDAEGGDVSAVLVKRIHSRKTARLLACALEAGALLAGAGPKTRAAMASAGMDLGLAFQGADDLLDVTASAAQLGKSPGKDAASGKATWIRVEGLPKARTRTLRYGNRGLKTLATSLGEGLETQRLVNLGHQMWNRDK